MLENRKVFVSGMGIVSSDSIGCYEFNKFLQNEKSAIRKVNNSTLLSYYAKIKDFCFEDEIKKLKNISEDLIKKAKLCTRRKNDMVKSCTLAAMEAYFDAGLYNIDYDRQKIGIIIAGSNFSQLETYEAAKKYSDNLEGISPSYALNYMDTNVLGVISEILDIHGEGFTVSGASASGNLAIVKGYQMIKYGICDVCLVVGPMTRLSDLELSAFNKLEVIGSEIYSPFQKGQNGFVPGETSSCIILESESSMKKRNMDLDIEVCSAVSFLDGNRSTNPSIEGEKNVMKKAIDSSKLKPSDIEYINAHGTGTPLGDKCELKAINDVFSQNVFVNSTKSYIGHCLNSAGITEAIATILQMRNGYIHTNLNLDNPICNEVKLVMGHNLKKDIKYALNNSFGFSGINTSIVLKNYLVL